MNIVKFIGQTPLVKLKMENSNCADVFVKIEHFNAGGSIKSRIAKRMVDDAEKSDTLYEGMTLIEATGGNTGIGLAIMAAIKNYRFIAVVPNNYSKERIDILRYFNAEVVLSDSTKGNDSHIELANDMQNKDKSLICLNQFENESCINAHYEGTATEILNEIIPDAFVACVGSGGTFTGVSRKLKEYSSAIKCYVSQPLGCDIMSGRAIKHKVQGVSIGIKPPLLAYDLIDDIIDIEYQDAVNMIKYLAKSQGLFLGISSGANIVAAYYLAKKLGIGNKVCTVAPDGGQYYSDVFR